MNEYGDILNQKLLRNLMMLQTKKETHIVG